MHIILSKTTQLTPDLSSYSIKIQPYTPLYVYTKTGRSSALWFNFQLTVPCSSYLQDSELNLDFDAPINHVF